VLDCTAVVVKRFLDDLDVLEATFVEGEGRAWGRA
jgi:hypothetical protein